VVDIWSGGIFDMVAFSICKSVFIALLLSNIVVICSAGELGSVGVCIRSRLDLSVDVSSVVGGFVCWFSVVNVDGFVLCASSVLGNDSFWESCALVSVLPQLPIVFVQTMGNLWLSFGRRRRTC
jgi:hypothetical protein